MNEYLFLFIHILTNIYFKVNSKYNVKIEKLHSLESIELLLKNYLICLKQKIESEKN